MNQQLRAYYQGLICDIIDYDPGPMFSGPQGEKQMMYLLLQFIIASEEMSPDWDSFLKLGEYIKKIRESYEEGRDILYDLRYYGDVSSIPADIVQGYDIYRNILNIMSHGESKDEEAVCMTQHSHYQYLKMIEEKYNAEKRKRYIRRTQPPQPQTAYEV